MGGVKIEKRENLVQCPNNGCIKSFFRYNEVVNKLDISVGYPY